MSLGTALKKAIYLLRVSEVPALARFCKKNKQIPFRLGLVQTTEDVKVSQTTYG